MGSKSVASSPVNLHAAPYKSNLAKKPQCDAILLKYLIIVVRHSQATPSPLSSRDLDIEREKKEEKRKDQSKREKGTYGVYAPKYICNMCESKSEGKERKEGRKTKRDSKDITHTNPHQPHTGTLPFFVLFFFGFFCLLG